MKFRSRLSLLSPFLFLFFTASKTPDLSCTCLTEIMGGTPLHTDREEQLLLLESNPNLSDLTEPVYKSELVTLLTNKQIEEVKYEPLKPYKGRVFLEEREFYAWTEVFLVKIPPTTPFGKNYSRIMNFHCPLPNESEKTFIKPLKNK